MQISLHKRLIRVNLLCKLFALKIVVKNPVLCNITLANQTDGHFQNFINILELTGGIKRFIETLDCIFECYTKVFFFNRENLFFNLSFNLSFTNRRK